ncbi:NADH-quinone oxidoreductase H/I [Streptomyces pristinaespiralis ATCC 25486]|uniref:NADH-quinone oxidoreductase subunit H n=2 Tax=Streptomyces pristinaespiralis TaxID=38300 RepID=D6X8H1_STRE2|nr:NADH-quinone oxidoreductase H/I [Streptomyces pristinaespiralis ATCC 25486]
MAADELRRRRRHHGHRGAPRRAGPYRGGDGRDGGGGMTVLALEDLSMFGRDPWWLVLIKAVFCFAFLMVTVLFSIVWERKVVAWMQLRIGPNRHGPWGMLQSLADGIKLMLKEDVIVKRADKIVYVLAPVVAAIPAFMAIAVIPFGPSGNEVSIFGQRTTMQLTDLPIAMLYILAIASVGIYGIVLAGWSSGSTYPLLGGLRSCAQMISYEIAMGAAFASVFLYSGSMSTSAIVEAQADRWFIILLPVSFIIYVVTMVGETNRAPFDMPESEGDLVGGFNTEYSSIKFAMFMLAEYVNMVTVSAVSVTLFLGGWRAPYPISTFWEGANHGWWPMLWFVLKVQLLLFFFIWLRGTLPRVRYDQLMKLGWKVLIPVSVVWLMLVATVRALRNENYDFQQIVLYVGGAVIAVLLLSFVADMFRGRKEKADEAAEAPPAAFDPMAGGFPVPPLPGQELPPVPRRRPRRERELIVSGGPNDSDGPRDGKEADGV